MSNLVMQNNETAPEWYQRTAELIRSCFTDEGFSMTREDSMGNSTWKGVFVQAFRAPGSLVLLTAHSYFGVDLSYLSENAGFDGSETLNECQDVSAIRAFIRACRHKNTH